MGVPHRFLDFEAILDTLAASSAVKFVTGREIASWYRAQVPPSNQETKA
jgi:hypothetical protein